MSPFTDIPISMYYVIITLTTVGYGDNGELVPTTGGGRALACFLAFAGILVLALPIAVIGQNFVELYRTYLLKLANIDVPTTNEIKRRKLRAVVGTTEADLNLLSKIDVCMEHER
jgi:hypothetical protein